MNPRILLISAFAAAACGRPEVQLERARSDDAARVQTTRVVRVDWPSTYERTGTVQARTSTVVSSRVMAYVREMPVKVGDRVRAGQVLALLDSRDLEAQKHAAMAAHDEAQSATVEITNTIASARATLHLAEATHRRMADLFAKTSISSQEMDEANAKLQVAQAQFEAAQSRRTQLDSKIRQAGEAVRSAEVMAGYTRIVAPFAGIVVDKPGQPGMLAAPGAPLLTLEREGDYRVEVPVEQSLLASVRPAQRVEVELDGAGPRFASTVVEVVPALDAASHSFIAKVGIPPGRTVRSGMFARVAFRAAVERVIAVPAASITGRADMPAAFVADNGIARLRLITVGREINGAREVLSGLKEGDLLIAPLPSGLRDGQRIEAQQ